HDHPVALAGAGVAGRAEDVETFAPARQHSWGGGEGQVVDEIVLACGRGLVLRRVPLVEHAIRAQLPPRHGPLAPGARPPAGGEEGRAPERLELRLVVHVLAAAGRGRAREGEAEEEAPS